MDTNFQTSFIPKKPLAESSTPVVHETSLFSFIATLVFFAMIVAAVAMYFYQNALAKSIASDSASLVAARNSFEPALITQLKTLDRRLTDANVLLRNHIAVSPIFAALQGVTLKSVQFTKFSYSTPSDPSAPITVRMSGRARDYSSIALESDELATNKSIHNPIFSNLTLDERTGTVTFDLVFTVDADLVRFTKHVDSFISQEGVPQNTQGGAANQGATPTTPANTTPPSSNQGTQQQQPAQ